MNIGWVKVGLGFVSAGFLETVCGRLYVHTHFSSKTRVDEHEKPCAKQSLTTDIPCAP